MLPPPPALTTGAYEACVDWSIFDRETRIKEAITAIKASFVIGF
jgi:hypothetical protein